MVLGLQIAALVGEYAIRYMLCVRLMVRGSAPVGLLFILVDVLFLMRGAAFFSSSA